MSLDRELFGGVTVFAAIAAGVLLLFLLIILIKAAKASREAARGADTVGSISGEIKGLASRMDSGLDGVREEIGSLEGGFVALEEDVRGLRKDYSSLRQDYSSLEEKVDELVDRKRFVSSIADVSEQVAALALPYDEYIEKYFFGIDREDPDTYEESDRDWPVFPGDPMPEGLAERKAASAQEREGLAAEQTEPAPGVEFEKAPIPGPAEEPAEEPGPEAVEEPVSEPEPVEEPAEEPEAISKPEPEPEPEPEPVAEPEPEPAEELEEEVPAPAPRRSMPEDMGFRIPAENPFPEAKPTDLSSFLDAQSPSRSERREQGVTTVEEILASMTRDLGEIPRTGLESLITPEEPPIGIPSNPYDITDTGRSGKHYSLDELEAQIRE